MKDIVISDGHRYHPGGLDFDGEFLWLPVAEYRPNSSTDIYRVDPTTYDVTKLFTVSDHIGGVVRDQKTGHLVGQSWGSGASTTGRSGRTEGVLAQREPLHRLPGLRVRPLPQDALLGRDRAPGSAGAATGYELGGMAMIDLRDRRRILHEVPLQVGRLPGT